MQRFPGGKKKKKKRQEGTTSTLAEEADNDVGDAVTSRTVVRSAEDGSAIRKVPRLREEGRKPERAPARPGRSVLYVNVNVNSVRRGPKIIIPTVIIIRDTLPNKRVMRNHGRMWCV